MVASSAKYRHLNDAELQLNRPPSILNTQLDVSVPILILGIAFSSLCTALITFQFSHILRPSSSCSVLTEELGRSYPILDELPTTHTQYKWFTDWGTEYAATNSTEVTSAQAADELWAGILPDHGVIAVDRKWAREQQWPDSMPLPKDKHGKEKSVYLLAAYHMIHCLKIMRQSFLESQRGLPLTMPLEHTMHCFDALRQSVQCHADNTPLYSLADGTAGHNQARKCKSWDALRTFATEHSACYRDSTHGIPLRDHFGFCEEGRPYQDGKDGLP